MPRLLLATRNPAKVREYSLLFQGSPFPVTTLAEEGVNIEVSETGNTLEENARIKATAYAIQSQFLVVADDSGLEVEALGGEPGPLSARYAGKDATDKERIALLLSRLQGVPWEKRTARFRCVIAIASSSRILGLCEGECRGVINFEPKGEEGFGYDPIFYLPELDRTMAELPLEEKNQVSHRGRAAQKAIQVLEYLRRGLQ
ncbi:MAG TPA: RdgB/HAM1 family non-canonical purine NTP pyrophosphatase [Dehalococcoidia bacterium]|nr:RdgB/HAM1 family non-canonical purine NTP pyrophosphatase [Dehalococcoidia bacterium]